MSVSLAMGLDRENEHLDTLWKQIKIFSKCLPCPALRADGPCMQKKHTGALFSLKVWFKLTITRGAMMRKQLCTGYKHPHQLHSLSYRLLNEAFAKFE